MGKERELFDIVKRRKTLVTCDALTEIYTVTKNLLTGKVEEGKKKLSILVQEFTDIDRFAALKYFHTSPGIETFITN